MERNKLNIVISIWTNICRYVLGVVFVFSGFVKAVDPLGTMYKVQEYFEAFGLSSSSFFPLLISICIALVEFCLGVYFLFGFRRRLSTLLSLVIMSAMTLLTLWLALANPISDCGCFGDAIVLSNWQTFFKNIVLLIAAITVFAWGNRITPLITKRFDWLVELYTVLFIGGIMFYSLRELPIFDFRPYHIGANVRESMLIPDGKEPSVVETYFIMEKDGKKEKFTAENYPDSTWTYVDSEMRVLKKGYEPPIASFSILSHEDGTNLEEYMWNQEGYIFLLVAPRLEKASEGSIDLINELYDYCLEYDYPFYCLTASSDDEITDWKERTGAEYPFAIVDDVILRTMIRSNPGLILLKDATIINKWSVNSIPDEYQLTDRLENLPLAKMSRKSPLRRVLSVILWFAVPLMAFSMLDVGWERYKNRKKQKGN